MTDLSDINFSGHWARACQQELDPGFEDQGVAWRLPSLLIPWSAIVVNEGAY
jgi:hypothetical protein